MSLDDILKAIAEDSTINKSKLDDASIAISSLQAKWIALLADAGRNLRAAQKHHDDVLKERTLHYTGKMSDQHYKDEPMQLKPLKTDLPLFLNADDAYQQAKDALHEAKAICDSIELFIKDLSQRSFNIRNAIEFQKFQAGM